MLPQAQDVAWRPGSWSARRPNAPVGNSSPGRWIKRGRGGKFFYFPKTLFSALLSVSFDAKERSFDIILDGNSKIGAHVRRNLSYLICLRHLIGSRAVTYRIFFLWKYLFSSIRSQHVLSYYLIMVPCMHLIHAKNICWAILRRGLKINLYKTSWSKNKLKTGGLTIWIALQFYKIKVKVVPKT